MCSVHISCAMVIKDDCVVVESVGGVDGPLICEDVIPNTSF